MRWNTGLVTKTRGRGGWSKHIGQVDHMYGPNRTWGYVRTLCGQSGRMYGTTTAEASSINVDCKVCLRSFRASVIRGAAL